MANKKSTIKMIELHNSKSPWLKRVAHKKTEDDDYSFKDELKTFLNSVTCHCYRHMAQTQRTIPERTMWILLHIFNATCFVFVAINAWVIWKSQIDYLIILKFIYRYEDFTTNPLVTTLHDTIHPIKNIPFPAVTVCPNNRISLKAAQELAKEL